MKYPPINTIHPFYSQHTHQMYYIHNIAKKLSIARLPNKNCLFKILMSPTQVVQIIVKLQVPILLIINSKKAK